MSDRHPSPLRPSQPEEGGPDAEARRQWYQWAESQRLQPHQEVAVRAALDLLKTGATATAAAAAGHVAASRANIQHVTQLQAEVAWIQSVIDDLKRQDAPAALIERYQARYAAVDAAMKLYWKPEAQAAAQAGVQSARHAREAEELQRRNAEAVLREEADARARQAEELKRQLEREAWLRRAAAGATAPSPVIEPAAPAASVAERPAAPAVPGPSAPAQPPGPPRLSFQEFLSEHSIMIVSYTGAFLLFIATLLFELYTINFNGELRFAGVAGLDLIFGAAGIACLRSQRLRLVGHTYVAIFALLAPLVFVAAYVFLNLQSKGISTDQAFLVSGLACCVLYIVLALRLRLHAYGVLALLSLPVAWLGAIDLLELGAWRGPALSPLALVYTLVLFESPRLKAAGDRFSRFALPFVHASAAASLVLTLYYLATAHGDWIPWVLASTAGGLAVSYIAFRALGGATYGSTIALSALTVAAAAAAYDSRLGDWRAATLSPMVALYTIVHLRPRWLGSRAQLFSADAYFFVHIAAGLVLVGIFAELAQAGHWIPWSITVALAGVAAGYALNRGVGGREEEAIGALLAFGPMWVAGVHDAGLGVWGGVAVSPLLAIYAMADRRSFSRYAEYFVHASALAAVLFVVLSASSFHSADWPAATAFAAVTAGYLVHRLVGGREPSGSLGLLTFGVAWLLAVDALGFSPWRGAALAPLAAVYSILASRRWKIIPSSATYFIHAALLAAAVVIGADMLSRNQWIPAVAAASAALFAIAYLLDTALNRREESALIALVLFGAAWVAGADALQLGWWRGATVAPLAVLYAVMAFRGARLGAVGELLSCRVLRKALC